MIRFNNLSFTYPGGKGIFGLDFSIRESETFGYLGPNGAGKTTTIRALLGFLRPKSGTCSIRNMDCWNNSADIQSSLGYLPGEITFPPSMTGTSFLDLLSDMRGIHSNKRRIQLSDRFEIDPDRSLKRMSKGMKQKIGIIAAFQHDPTVYVLDEPTSGLDPLMQKRFTDLVLEEKSRGKTFLLSSHLFSETERLCDRVGILRAGHLAAICDIADLKETQRRTYTATLATPEDSDHLLKQIPDALETGADRFQITVRGSVDSMIKTLASVNVTSLDTNSMDLEEVFMQYYHTQEGGV